ncbi:MAG: FmdB family zinc ribbon protein [Candidatus Methylomirabilaceae bacterium]
MPTYEYRCTQCEHVFDCLQRVGDPAPACPKCGSPTRKVFSSVGLIFKGKGFHSTDYRKPAPADGETAPGPNAASHDEATSGTPGKGASPTAKDTTTPTKDAAAPKGGASSSASDS